MAGRPSKAISVGKPAVKPSADRPTSWVAPSRTTARFRISTNGTPSQIAFPTRSPPTSLETHASVSGQEW